MGEWSYFLYIEGLFVVIKSKCIIIVLFKRTRKNIYYTQILTLKYTSYTTKKSFEFYFVQYKMKDNLLITS